eukprot:scaffold34305_cov62-Phaeocystis_antarctica.AAC.2
MLIPAYPIPVCVQYSNKAREAACARVEATMRGKLGVDESIRRQISPCGSNTICRVAQHHGSQGCVDLLRQRRIPPKLSASADRSGKSLFVAACRCVLQLFVGDIHARLPFNTAHEGGTSHLANVTSKYATRLRRQILIMLITSMAERFFCFGGGVSFCGDKICTIESFAASRRNGCSNSRQA